ncbi:hypothetical protein MMYC01_203140 [Madurella mycetomatis]|uniref:Uncharacterized protein n=1 Tax=Madurella mycetomatis TaxID=100816 RepID=A0A175W2N4_9PEZI|nr:hypothetical protein MMYC01_205256 [Madurella mycetomatis]KXX79520.1 hypothetical protein MMYC01_203140 [Madurella mycetomatis]
MTEHTDASPSLVETLVQMQASLHRVETRFDRLETRFDNIETCFDNIETRFDNIETRLDRLETRLDRLETSHTEPMGKVAQPENDARANFHTLEGKIDQRFPDGRLLNSLIGDGRLQPIIDERTDVSIPHLPRTLREAFKMDYSTMRSILNAAGIQCPWNIEQQRERILAWMGVL